MSDDKIIIWKNLKSLFRLPNTISDREEKAVTYDSIKEVYNPDNYMQSTDNLNFSLSKKCITWGEIKEQNPTVKIKCTITENRPLVPTQANTIKFYYCYETQDRLTYETQIGEWRAGDTVNESASGYCDVSLKDIVINSDQVLVQSYLKVWCGTTGSNQNWNYSYVVDGTEHTTPAPVTQKTSVSFKIHSTGANPLKTLESVQFDIL